MEFSELHETIEEADCSEIQRKRIEKGYLNAFAYKNTRRCKIIRELRKKWIDYGEFEDYRGPYLWFDRKRMRSITDKLLVELMKDIERTWTTSQMKFWPMLELNLEHCFQVTDFGLRKPSPYLHEWFRDLKRPAFNLLSGNQVTDKGLRIIARYLQYFSQDLKSFGFSFQNNEKISMENFKRFISKISKILLNLEILHLTFPNLQITDQSVQEIFSSFGSTLINVKTVSLNLEKCENITHNAMKPLINYLMTSFSNLSVLKLKFADSDKIFDQGAVILSTELGVYAKRISEFQLIMGRMTYEGVHALSTKFIPEASNLQALSLSFDKISSSVKSIRKLIIQIGTSLPKLETLSLSFSDLTDRGLHFVTAEIETSLHKLKTFCLRTSSSVEVTDNSIIKLVTSIRKHMLKLENLCLYFYPCRWLTPAIIEDLTLWDFRHLPNLKCLSLSFFCYDSELSKTKKLLKESLQYIPSVSII